jgi:hypothetical protein
MVQSEPEHEDMTEELAGVLLTANVTAEYRLATGLEKKKSTENRDVICLLRRSRSDDCITGELDGHE